MRKAASSIHALISHIYVYSSQAVEIQWKFKDEYGMEAIRKMGLNKLFQHIPILTLIILPGLSI